MMKGDVDDKGTRDANLTESHAVISRKTFNGY